MDTTAENSDTQSKLANQDSLASLITNNEFKYPSRVMDIMKNESAGLSIEIIDAYSSHDYSFNQLNGYVVYFIKFGNLSIKRRYSEFEVLRNCLIKLFPTLIIPPIPEKQSLKSNIVNATSNSFGLATSSLNLNTHNLENINDPVINSDMHNKNNDYSNIIHNTTNDHGDNTNNNNSNSDEDNNNSNRKNPSFDANSSLDLIGYRKRMLSEFLNKCLKIDKVSKSKYFLYFLDPEINFFDFITNKDNEFFYKTSIYQLSPIDPIKNLQNQLYLTMPIPSSSDSYLFKELEDEAQFQKFIKFEEKFLKYELVLNNISKINKRLIKHMNELSVEFSDLSISFNRLSILQDSNEIEHVGKLFNRNTIILTNFVNLINIEFLDKLIELKNFSTTVKGLMGYNRKKIIQLKIVEKKLFEVRSKYKRYESEEIRIRKIDQKMDSALNHHQNNNNNNDFVEPPITDEELQTALFTKSSNKKSVYVKIPGVSKLNNMILKYVNDPNPDETRRTKFYDIKLRLFQLERQYQMLQEDLKFINENIMIQLNEFHLWFKKELSYVVTVYQQCFKEFVKKGQEPWQEVDNELSK